MLNAFHIICLRIFLNIKQEDHVTNESMYLQADVMPFSDAVKLRQLHFLDISFVALRIISYPSSRSTTRYMVNGGTGAYNKYFRQTLRSPHGSNQHPTIWWGDQQAGSRPLATTTLGWKKTHWHKKNISDCNRWYPMNRRDSIHLLWPWEILLAPYKHATQLDLETRKTQFF